MDNILGCRSGNNSKKRPLPASFRLVRENGIQLAVRDTRFIKRQMRAGVVWKEKPIVGVIFLVPGCEIT